MTETVEAAHILFPNDAPASVRPVVNPTTSLAARDTAAAYTSAARNAPGDLAEPPAGLSGDATAARLFPTEDANETAGERLTADFAEMALHAHAGGDTARAADLREAGAALREDIRESGGLVSDLAEALGYVRDGMGRLEPLTPAEAERASELALAEIGTGYADAGALEADLTSARRLVAHMERRAPGTIASLERSGAGNDPRVIRAAIKEAKRRGL